MRTGIASYSSTMNEEHGASLPERKSARVQIARLEAELNELRSQLRAQSAAAEELAAAKLKITSDALTKQITTDFYESVKRWLWLVAIVAVVATLGGALTLSDLLKSRIDAAVEGKQSEIDKLRVRILDSLIEVKLSANMASQEIAQIKVDLESTKLVLESTKRVLRGIVEQAEKEGKLAQTQMRGLLLTFKKTVNKQGQSTVVVADARPATVGPVISSDQAARPEPRDWFDGLPSNTVAIFSTSFYGVSYASKQGSDFSVAFSSAAFAAASDLNKDGRISIAEAFAATSNEVAGLNRPGKSQQPRIFGTDQSFPLLSATAGPLSSRPIRRIYLFAVGISDYGEYRINLPGSDLDAKKLISQFQNNADRMFATEVVTYELMNSAATASNFRAQFATLTKTSTPNDIFVFYYSGHQYTPKGSVPQKFLVPYSFKDQDGLISLKELAVLVGSVPANQRIVLIDA